MKVSFGVFTIFTGSIVWTVPTALVLQKASVATEQARSVVWAKKKSTPDRGDLCPAMCSYADLVLDPLVPKKGRIHTWEPQKKPDEFMAPFAPMTP